MSCSQCNNLTTKSRAEAVECNRANRWNATNRRWNVDTVTPGFSQVRQSGLKCHWATESEWFRTKVFECNTRSLSSLGIRGRVGARLLFTCCGLERSYRPSGPLFKEWCCKIPQTTDVISFHCLNLRQHMENASTRSLSSSMQQSASVHEKIHE